MAPLVLDKTTTAHLFQRISGLEQWVGRLSQNHLQLSGFVPEAKNGHPQHHGNVGNHFNEPVSFPLAQGQSIFSPVEHKFPSVQESDMIIEFFLKNTEPFILMLHVPFFHVQLAEYRGGQNPPYFEAVLPSIHALGLATLSSTFVLDFFGRRREELISITRRNAEEALTKIDFMRSQHPIVLRGLLYFVTFLFEIGENEYASSLLGVALRAALSIGLNHDSADVYPFVRDAHRRSWLYLRYLDDRAAKILGVESMTKPEWNTPPPFNVTEDTWEMYRTARAGVAGESPAIQGYTDVSFVLVRAKVQILQEQILSSDMTFQDMEILIANKKRELWEEYLSNHGSTTLPNFAIALLDTYIGAISLAARQVHHKEANDDFRGQTFVAGIELLERISTLEANIEYIQYMWVLRSFIPMRAVIIVLSGTLFRSSLGYEARAWEQIGKVYDRYDNADCRVAKTSTFEPINALREQALEVKHHRESQSRT